MYVDGKLYALVVGINRYDSDQLRDLECAAEDAVAVRDWLRDRLGLADDCCFFYTDPPRRGVRSQPTRAQLLSGLDAMSRSAMGPQDTFVLFFAGHGYDMEGETYLCTSDSEPGSAGLLADTAVSMTMLRRHLRRIRAGQQWIILDACRNAPRLNTRSAACATWEPAMSRDVLTLPRDPGSSDTQELRRARAILSSCWEGQHSYEGGPGRARHGWFCQNLLDNLRARPDGPWELDQHWVAELKQQMLARALPKFRAALDQHPHLVSEGETVRFWLGEPPKPTVEPDQSSPPVFVNRHRQRRIRWLKTFAAGVTGSLLTLAAAWWGPEAWRAAKELQRPPANPGTNGPVQPPPVGPTNSPPASTNGPAGGTGPKVVIPPPGPQPDQRWTNSLGMVLIPLPGTGLHLAECETRVMDFDAYCRARGKSLHQTSFPQGTNHPVVNVSHHEALAFCAWLTATERTNSLLTTRHSYRLPSWSEWVRAALGDAPRVTRYAWGDAWPPPAGKANLAGTEWLVAGVPVGGIRPLAGWNDEWQYTAPAGQLLRSTQGWSHLVGNVHEWLADEVRRGQRRYVGGAWDSNEEDQLRLDEPLSLPPELSRQNLGFRCLLETRPKDAL